MNGGGEGVPYLTATVRRMQDELLLQNLALPIVFAGPSGGGT